MPENLMMVDIRITTQEFRLKRRLLRLSVRDGTPGYLAGKWGRGRPLRLSTHQYCQSEVSGSY